MFRSIQLSKILNDFGQIEDDIETVYLIGLEGGASDPNWSTARKVLDAMVRAFQPSPVLTHVELLLLPRSRGDEVHFSTYLGHSADWGSGFQNSRDFYLGYNSHSWRAIPVQGRQIAEMMRRVCAMSIATPYSLTRYAFSVPPLRSFAGILPDKPRSPAHCAGLSARLLSESSRDVHLPRPAPWYSPSTLFIELSRSDRMRKISQRATDLKHTASIAETEEIAGAVETLLRGSDSAVQTMSASISVKAIRELGDAVALQRCSQRDAVRERILEKQLARALLRFVELNS